VSEHSATVEWQRTTPDFQPATYDRAYVFRFEDGLSLAGTAARANIPATAPQAPGADPEQMLVASLSSCHMLWFLYLAANAKLVVDRYADRAVGVLGKDRDGKTAMIKVTLRPAVA
jgi:organic hydroperoxide reductase OsmC/OhrA